MTKHHNPLNPIELLYAFIVLISGIDIHNTSIIYIYIYVGHVDVPVIRVLAGGGSKRKVGSRVLWSGSGVSGKSGKR